MRLTAFDYLRTYSLDIWGQSVIGSVFAGFLFGFWTLLLIIPTSLWLTYSLSSSSAARARLKTQIGPESSSHSD